MFDWSIQATQSTGMFQWDAPMGYPGGMLQWMRYSSIAMCLNLERYTLQLAGAQGDKDFVKTF